MPTSIPKSDSGYWDVSGDGPTGSTYFSGDESDFGMLVGMAIGHSYKVEDKIIKLLGKVDFVYQDTGPDLKGPFRLLEAALEKYGPLPTEDGGSRHVSATEFMLMQPDPVQGHYQFKHSRTRNYVFLNARRGILVVPQTDQAFKRGFF